MRAHQLISVSLIAAGFAIILITGACSLANADGSVTPPPVVGDETPAPSTDDAKAKREVVEIAGERFRLEIAADTPARERGLMKRTKIADDGGMIFIYPDARVRRFWMAYCLMDIDVMFIDRRGRIVAMYEMKPEAPRAEDESDFRYGLRLKRYSSRRAVRFAIELKPGTMKRLGLEVGDVIDLDHERLGKLAK